MTISVAPTASVPVRATRRRAPLPLAPVPALVHDYLLVLRGAERTFAAMADAWPDAPLYTLLYDPSGTHERFEDRNVRTSRLQRLRIRQNGFRRMLPLFPLAAERLAYGRHDLVVSSSSAFAHRTVPAPGGIHVCYCHSPFRYLWHERARVAGEVRGPLLPFVDRLLDAMRASDAAAGRAVTHFVANSRLTQQRIADFWGRESTVIHPPVDVERFTVGEPEDWFLWVGEMVAHKRTETAILAAQRAGVRLKLVGTGPEHARLAGTYDDADVEFLGRVDDDELASLYRRARAFVLPNVEEFGIAAVEAQAAGRPVVAIDAGGATETVVDGVTGVRVTDGDVDALAEALRETDFDRFDPDAIVANAARFSTCAFQDRLRAEVEAAWAAR